jgi:hypothetical protein
MDWTSWHQPPLRSYTYYNQMRFKYLQTLPVVILLHPWSTRVVWNSCELRNFRCFPVWRRVTCLPHDRLGSQSVGQFKLFAVPNKRQNPFTYKHAVPRGPRFISQLTVNLVPRIKLRKLESRLGIGGFKSPWTSPHPWRKTIAPVIWIEGWRDSRKIDRKDTVMQICDAPKMIPPRVGQPVRRQMLIGNRTIV